MLRRLGRVVECTRAPAALGAALEALGAVADDAGWEEEDKVGRTENKMLFGWVHLQNCGHVWGRYLSRLVLSAPVAWQAVGYPS